MAPKALVAYYSRSGGTQLMAEEIAEGLRSRGIDVDVRRIEDCRVRDLRAADVLVLGSPTYFSNMSWQVKRLVDESIELYTSGDLSGKVFGCFTSAGTRRDAEECIKMLELAFGFHHRMRSVPGIYATSGESREQIRERCREYAGLIAKALLEGG